MSVVIPVKFVNKPNLMEYEVIPKFAKPGDAGCDAVANLVESVVIHPGDRALIPLGVCMAIPEGYWVMVAARSGLALKHGVTLANSCGVVDQGYRNELGAILINHGIEDFRVNPGDRICQLILLKHESFSWRTVEELPDSERGMGGFGSTGVANG